MHVVVQAISHLWESVFWHTVCSKRVGKSKIYMKWMGGRQAATKKSTKHPSASHRVGSRLERKNSFDIFFPLSLSPSPSFSRSNGP